MKVTNLSFTLHLIINAHATAGHQLDDDRAGERCALAGLHYESVRIGQALRKPWPMGSTTRGVYFNITQVSPPSVDLNNSPRLPT